MSHGFKAVTWTPFKKRFDTWMLTGVAVYLTGFVAVSALAVPEGESFTPVQMMIRATGTLAFLMLTFILCVGPLARLTPRFKPLLYNRRHLGVTTFLIAAVHAGLVTLWYHGFSGPQPLRFASGLQSSIRFHFRISVRIPGADCAPDPLPYGGDQPRLLECQSWPWSMEGDPYVSIRGLRITRCTHRSRRDPVREAPRLCCSAGIGC
jgi:hypothetical protein